MVKRTKKLIDVRHPFFRPAWRRWALTVFLVGWTIFELVWGSILWAAFFGVIAVICIREFFIDFDPANYEDPDA